MLLQPNAAIVRGLTCCKILARHWTSRKILSTKFRLGERLTSSSQWSYMLIFAYYTVCQSQQAFSSSVRHFWHSYEKVNYESQNLCPRSTKLMRWIFFVMQTHRRETVGQLCFMCWVRFHAPRPPHATELSKQQRLVVWWWLLRSLFMLSLTLTLSLCLRLIILVDSFVSDLGPISSIKFVRYILNCAYIVF